MYIYMTLHVQYLICACRKNCYILYRGYQYRKMDGKIDRKIGIQTETKRKYIDTSKYEQIQIPSKYEQINSYISYITYVCDK